MACSPSRRCCRRVTACTRCSRRFPRLTRSSLQSCLQRHAISRLPQIAGDMPIGGRFKSYPIGYFHIDVAEVRLAAGRTRSVRGYRAHARGLPACAWKPLPPLRRPLRFLQSRIDALAYRIHTVLTDNGLQIGALPSLRNGPTVRLRTHRFNRACITSGIEHRTIAPDHPLTNGPIRPHKPHHQASATVKHHHSAVATTHCAGTSRPSSINAYQVRPAVEGLGRAGSL